jgi:hypothetical protein
LLFFLCTFLFSSVLPVNQASKERFSFCCKQACGYLKTLWRSLSRRTRELRGTSSSVVAPVTFTSIACLERHGDVCEIFAPLCKVYGYIPLENLRAIVENQESRALFFLFMLRELPACLLENDRYIQLVPEARTVLVCALLHMFSSLYTSRCQVLPAIHELCFGGRNWVTHAACLLNKLLLGQIPERNFTRKNLRAEEAASDQGLTYQSLSALRKYVLEGCVQKQVRFDLGDSVTCLAVLKQKVLGEDSLIVPPIYNHSLCFGDRPVFNSVCFGEALSSASASTVVSTPVSCDLFEN